MSDEAQQLKELVTVIQQFFSHQIESNQSLSDVAKESLTVASECIEQAYEIQRKEASNELVDIYKSHKQRSQGAGGAQAGAGGANNATAFIQNLANTILSQATSSASGQPQQQQQPQPQQTASAPRQSREEFNKARPGLKPRKDATEAEKMAAESFKNQGNDFMKQDKYQEAFDCYSDAIKLDNYNAIYYSNRAAASSKLLDHQGALLDCQMAVDIDPTYSKAYGRMGLAYASLDDHKSAREAYLKAVELDPNNESYRNNLKIAEEKLAEERGTAGNASGGGQNNMMGMLRSMMSNPEVMQMAMRSLQDPRMQNLFGLGGQATGAQPTGNQQQQSSTTATAGQTESANLHSSSNTQTPQPTATEDNNSAPNQQQPSAGVNPADLFNLTSHLTSSANDLVGASQQILSSIEQNNPDLVNNMRRMMNQAFMPQNQNDSDRNPPPGYS